MSSETFRNTSDLPVVDTGSELHEASKQKEACLAKSGKELDDCKKEVEISCVMAFIEKAFPGKEFAPEQRLELEEILGYYEPQELADHDKFNKIYKGLMKELPFLADSLAKKNIQQEEKVYDQIAQKKAGVVKPEEEKYLKKELSWEEHLKSMGNTNFIGLKSLQGELQEGGIQSKEGFVKIKNIEILESLKSKISEIITNLTAIKTLGKTPQEQAILSRAVETASINIGASSPSEIYADVFAQISVGAKQNSGHPFNKSRYEAI